MKIQPQTSSSKQAFVLLSAICLLTAQTLRAGTETWNGGGVPDGNWQNSGNWGGILPLANDRLIFAGGTQTTTTNNYSINTPFNNLTFNSGASPFLLKGNAFVLASPTDAGSGLIVGGSINDASVGTQSILVPIVLASGNHTINSTGGGPLKLSGLITHSNGAVVTMSGNINATGAFTTNGSGNGILGGYAVFANNWATLDASSNVVAYTGYTDIAGAGTIPNNPAANIRIPVNGGAISITPGATAINSLFFGSTNASGAAQTVNIGAGNKLVLGQNGGIFNSTAVAGAGTYRNLVIGANVAQGGTLTAGDGTNAAQITLGSATLPSAAGFITINSVITDNGSAPVSVTLAGAYASMNGGGNNATTNTYSGGTYILQGRISQPGRYTFGYGPVYIVSGGQANCGCQITNDFYIEGSGTVENQGMGALRLYSASLANGFTGNILGTVHLTGAANVCADNIAVATQFVGISGKITGPGSLGIGSPTATTRSGIINIGSTNGLFDIPNDYAGDTMINGTAAGTFASTLRIVNSADDNIMPHGLTGSYAGGKTGNLVFNATSATLQSLFDLNGSTQTINGLSSTARGSNPANNIVEDTSPSGNGALIVGDSDATSTFAGVIQNAIMINKIGAGTLTLSGANTYTGDTIITAGKLVTTTASSGGGNFVVGASAALGVTLASGGSTLNLNNLTFNGGSLQLNAGSFGDPTAPILHVNGNLTMSSNVTISLSGVGLTAGGPFTVMTCNPSSRTGPGSFVLVNSPRIVATLNDDAGSGTVSVTIISADSAVKWNGGANGVWDVNDTNNTIWQTVPSALTTYYIEAGSGNDVALFNDSLTGTSNVNLSTTLSPQAITVSNSGVNYTFGGAGRITGPTGLTKQGSGTLTIANSGNNDFTGNIVLGGGTVVINNTSSIGNTFSGSGALAKSGSGTLALNGDGSAYTGPVTINGGTLSVLNTASLGTASSVTVGNGGTLDIGVNSVGLAQVPITVSGAGVNGNGAIVNSSGYGGGAIATSFQDLILAGDTSIGGPGRLDFRADDVNNGTNAVLSTSGHAYKLTKLTGSILQLAGVQVDNALGDIDVQGGTLGIQGAISSLGNPTNTLTVFGNATFQFLSVNNPLTKNVVLKDGAIVNNNTGANTFGGAITLQGVGLFNIGGSALTLTNFITGPGTLSKVTGAGGLYLSGSNSYAGDTVLNAGSLFLLEPASLRSSRSISLAANTTLDVSGRADGTLALPNGQKLSGAGAINGIVIESVGSTIAPGINASTLGTLTITSDATLNGATAFKLSETNLTCDVLNVNGTVNYGGTLQLTTLNGTLTAGDSFQLFTAGSYNGLFANIVPVSPGPGLVWNTNTLSSGVLTVGLGLTITNFTLSGNTLTLSGGGGSPNAPYTVLSSTNLAATVNRWVPIATPSFDGGGNFSFTTNINTSLPQEFFTISP